MANAALDLPTKSTLLTLPQITTRHHTITMSLFHFRNHHLHLPNSHIHHINPFHMNHFLPLPLPLLNQLLNQLPLHNLRQENYYNFLPHKNSNLHISPSLQKAAILNSF